MTLTGTELERLLGIKMPQTYSLARLHPQFLLCAFFYGCERGKNEGDELPALVTRPRAEL